MLIDKEKILKRIAGQVAEANTAFDNANELYKQAVENRKQLDQNNHIRTMYEANAKMTVLGKLHRDVIKMDGVKDTPPPKKEPIKQDEGEDNGAV